MALRGQCAAKGSLHRTRLTENIIHQQKVYWLSFVHSTAFIRNDIAFCTKKLLSLLNPDLLVTWNVLYTAFVTFVFVCFVSIRVCIYVCMNVRTYVRICVLVYYLLTPWCRVLLEKLTGLQLVKKFPTFHGTRRFITALTSAATCLYPGPAQSSPYTHIPPPGDPS